MSEYFDYIFSLNSLLRNKCFSPTKAQSMSIEPIINDRNVLLIAPTGMGKTEAAILPMFHNILTKKYTQAIAVLYITPLRALNRDMLRRLKEWGKELDISLAVRHGDTDVRERRAQAIKPPMLLITTPETLQLLLIGKRLKEGLKNVRTVIMDEIHELAEDERGAQLSIALERLEALTGRNIQRIGLSATVGTPEEIAHFLVGVGRDGDIVNVLLGKSMDIVVEAPVCSDDSISIAEELNCDEDMYACLLRAREIINSHKSVLFFVNTRDTAELLSSRFSLMNVNLPPADSEDLRSSSPELGSRQIREAGGFVLGSSSGTPYVRTKLQGNFVDHRPRFPAKSVKNIGVHHGSLSKTVRMEMEDLFKNQSLNGLICTSSLELGIDVGTADYTIQFNSPRQVIRMVQRLGRAGHRWDKLSQGTILSTNPDEIAESAVIAKMTVSERLEPTVIRKTPMSVIANQVIAILMESGNTDLKKIHALISKAYPFRDLGINELNTITQYLNDIGVIRVEGDEIRKRKRSISYFYENISMIPDQMSFRVTDAVSRRTIGILDESFITSHIDENFQFIMKGVSWRVVSIEDDCIIVSPSTEIGAVPSWIGEEIPVPYEVAQGVGRLRFDVLNNSELNYPMDEKAKKKLIDYIINSSKVSPPAMHNTITLEVGSDRKLIIIHCCFGTNVNETIGLIIGGMLAAKLGSHIATHVDAYRVMIALPSMIDKEFIINLLHTILPDDVEKIVRKLIPSSPQFKWFFIRTARKFGVIEKNIDYSAISIEKIIDIFKGSPIFSETVEYMLWHKLDVEKTEDIFNRIQNGDILINTGRLSPIGISGLSAAGRLMRTEKIDRPLLLKMKDRLMRKELNIICIHCGHTFRGEVRHINIRCLSCNSKLLSVMESPEDVKIVNKWKKKKELNKKLNKIEMKRIKRLYTSANTVMAHGGRALLALAARGVGITTACRIMEKQYDTEEEFLRALFQAELTYARTKRFWD